MLIEEIIGKKKVFLITLLTFLLMISNDELLMTKQNYVYISYTH